MYVICWETISARYAFRGSKSRCCGYTKWRYRTGIYILFFTYLITSTFFWYASRKHENKVGTYFVAAPQISYIPYCQPVLVPLSRYIVFRWISIATMKKLIKWFPSGTTHSPNIQISQMAHENELQELLESSFH